MHVRFIWKFLKNTNAQVLLFYQNSRLFLVSNNVEKQMGYMRIFYLHLICFIFSISYSVLPFHLVYVFWYFHLFFFFMFFLKTLSSIKMAFVYIYINNMYNIFNLEDMNFWLTKICMTFWFHLFDLVQIEC